MHKLTKEAIRKLVDPLHHQPELALVDLPCFGCDKIVSLAPSRSSDKLGVRCLYCLKVLCRSCAEKHFEPKRKVKRCKFQGKAAKVSKTYGMGISKIDLLDKKMDKIMVLLRKNYSTKAK